MATAKSSIVMMLLVDTDILIGCLRGVETAIARLEREEALSTEKPNDLS